ncbi:sigma-70 family RNA polymerase sigma factor [Prosthecobacter sp.]|jgi:RNA polymerase sigma-70 factor (ECF subfamily)|uniref:sigma-70 family RNA polymerase sigma factor n=1 Tax=Prosthecobacter sp. TaxID=1965333 RepID=UPI003784E76D
MSPPSEHERHAQFLRHYAESEVALHTFVRSLVPTRQMASEVMQDVILVLWEKFDAAADFQGWAFGVAKNIALRHLRRQSRDRHVFDDELVNQLADDAAALVPVHDGHREALEHCLEKLPAAQRELVLSAYTKGTRMDELATRRGQSPMALYKLLHRIRQALLECVERTLAKEEHA